MKARKMLIFSATWGLFFIRLNELGVNFHLQKNSAKYQNLIQRGQGDKSISPQANWG